MTRPGRTAVLPSPIWRCRRLASRDSEGSADFARFSSGQEHCAHKKFQGNIGFARLHFGDSGLAGPESIGKDGLGEADPDASGTKLLRQGKPHLDDGNFIRLEA